MSTLPQQSAPGSDNRREQFSKMPEAILHDPRLSDRAKLALLEIETFAWGPEGRCWASVETMAGRLGWSTRKMQYALRELRALKHVEAEDRRGKTTRYRPLQDRAPLPLQDLAPEIEEVEVDAQSGSRRGRDERSDASANGTTTMTNVDPHVAEDVLYDGEYRVKDLLDLYDHYFKCKFGRPPRRKDGDLERARELFAMVHPGVFEDVAIFAFEHDFSLKVWPKQFPTVEQFEGAERSYRAEPDADDLDDVIFAEDD